MSLKKKARCLLVCLLVCFSVSSLVVGNTQEAHVHGVAMLTLAIDKEVLVIHFESPAANLVGFEYQARSPEEKQIVKQVESLLASPKQLFLWVGTDCQTIKTTVNSAGVMASDQPHGDHSEAHHTHEHEMHHSDHDSQRHSDITAEYHFRCHNTHQLKRLVVTLFSHFPGIEKINVQWVTSTRQAFAWLFPDKNTLSLKLEK
jgi:hypothetical protein